MTTSISELSAQVRQLRTHETWWKDPRWARLFSIFALFMVLSILTNQVQGSSTDYTLLFKNSWFSARGAEFLIGSVIVWVIAEVWRARGLSRIAAQATKPVRQAKDIAALKNPWVKRGSLLVLVVVAVLLPYIGLFSTSYFQSVLSDQVGVFVLAAVGLNVVVGWAGLLDLGYIAFFAIGAYTTAILSGRLPIGADGNPEAHPPIHLNLFFAFPIAVLLTMAAGLILGAPTLRLRGDYLAIVTLGFHEIVLNIASNNPKNITGGALGATDISTFRFNLFGVHYDWHTNDAKPYWFLAIGLIIAVVFAFRRLEHSKVGRTWTAIREDEVAAAASGVPTVKYKLMAFAIGASTSGFAGVLATAKTTAITPQNFPLPLSVTVLAYVIFGGMGSLTGVIVGASLMTFLPYFLQGPPSWFNGGQPVVDPKDVPMWIGAVLLTMMIFRPQGLIPSKRRAQELAQAEHGLGDADAMTEPAEGVAP
ncbi:branched-chain amino acid transport system permease protein [Catenulispora sp. GP43]|uniref:branched-chain amino acid ABC transporter permease n=1 Tax=Catenulispora sp. GP43 TaxID=3156263 RepID=UPI0035175BCE